MVDLGQKKTNDSLSFFMRQIETGVASLRYFLLFPKVFSSRFIFLATIVCLFLCAKLKFGVASFRDCFHIFKLANSILHHKKNPKPKDFGFS